MELRELKALVSVVQTGSFTLAAQRLNTDKAYVSRLISGLERKLGIQLLQRNTRTLSVTEIGTAVYERAVNILQMAEDTEQLTQSFSSEPSGLLRLTASPSFGRLCVNNWINQYLAKYHKVSIEADYTGRNVDLVHEGFDLAIRIGNLQDSNLVARSLGEIKYGLFASPAYLERYGFPQTPDVLSQHSRLHMSGSTVGDDWLLYNEGNEFRVKGASRLKLNDSYGLCDAAINGLGIARLPLLFAETIVAKGKLISVLPQWTHISAPIHAIFPKSRYASPKVRSFVDFILEQREL